MTARQLTYLSRNGIDEKKWNNCITAAPNGLIYAYTFYLDSLSKNWDALVLGNYECVMPLPWNKKFGIYYLYQPFFTASLGVFGHHLSSSVIERFLDSIPRKFRYWDIYLNKENVFQLNNYNLYERHNYVLPMNDTYQNISARYRKSHDRNIKRAQQLGSVVKTNIPVGNVIDLAKEQSQSYSTIHLDDYNRFTRLYELLKSRGDAKTYGVYNMQNQLVSSGVYFYSHNRAYYILAGNHPDGRTSGASHFLIDAFIKDHAGKELILDFEGSDIRKLAWFYSSFGASEEIYAGLKLNKLPSLIRVLKQ